MKKILILFSILAVSVCFAGCGNRNVEQLKAAVAEVDKECPVSLGMMGEMLSVKCDEEEKNVKFVFSLNEEVISVDYLKNNKRSSKKMVKLSFSRENAADLMQPIVDAGYGVEFVYKNREGDSLSIEISNDELQELLDNPASDKEINEMMLESQISMINELCPFDVDSGTELAKVFDNGDNIVYKYNVDEDLVNVSALEYSKSEMKDYIKSSFDDPAVKSLIAIIEPLGKGLIYRYTGDESGDYVDIVFTNTELKKYK